VAACADDIKHNEVTNGNILKFFILLPNNLIMHT